MGYLFTSWHLFSFLLYAAIQTKKDGQVLLSIGILTTSISSLGCLGFFYFFYRAMGG
ncbi:MULTISPECIES: hypothetical protein [Priestia]|uniref:hypothetical protein n=1 Tax=Priestia TaxID=2800373 RepID=UPI0021D692D3|nr:MULTISPECIES: hypothetical protein [Priestia]MCJ7989003.1 hypothetical protein [Priestia sp. OVS21]MCU7711284.1 hypothetical protein [Priestia megaterium]MCW1045865.1 hypothetical protein [Priestia sp. JV24]MDH3186992.1 hypothetical protein [Priestia megaterium]